MKNSLILDKVMQLCRKSSSPSLVYTLLFFTYLPTFHRFSSFLFLASHLLSTLPSFYLPLLLPFPVPSVVLYIPLSLSSFLILSKFPFSLSSSPFPSQSSPSLLFLFPTYSLPTFPLPNSPPYPPLPFFHYYQVPLFPYFFPFVSPSLFLPFFFPLFRKNLRIFMIHCF